TQCAVNSLLYSSLLSSLSPSFPFLSSLSLSPSLLSSLLSSLSPAFPFLSLTCPPLENIVPATSCLQQSYKDSEGEERRGGRSTVATREQQTQARQSKREGERKREREEREGVGCVCVCV